MKQRGQTTRSEHIRREGGAQKERERVGGYFLPGDLVLWCLGCFRAAAAAAGSETNGLVAVRES